MEFIVPSSWHGGPMYESLRNQILEYRIRHLIELPFDMFKSAYVDTAIFGMEKASKPTTARTLAYSYPKHASFNPDELSTKQQIDQREWATTAGSKFILSAEKLMVEKRVSACHATFGDYLMAKRGVLFDKTCLVSQKTAATPYHFFQGDIYRYVCNTYCEKWIGLGEYIKEGPRDISWYSGKRILLRRLMNRQHRLMATIVGDTFITNKNLYVLKPHDQELTMNLLGLLNSRLLSFLYASRISQATKDDFPQVTLKDLLALPIPYATSSEQGDITALVEKVLTVKASDHTADTTGLETAIDAAVYRLYGLTVEEIAVVECGGGKK